MVNIHSTPRGGVAAHHIIPPNSYQQTPHSHLAAEAFISVRNSRNWWDRRQSGGVTALAERRMLQASRAVP